MFDKNLLISISFVLLWTYFDLKRAYLTSIVSKSSDKIISEDVLIENKTQEIIIIKIQYCYSCGYRKQFEQFSELIHKNYPTMNIISENYSSDPLRTLLAKILSFIKMGLLICLLFGQNPFLFFNISTPKIYSWALQNKLYACLMIFFFSNTLESYLISTGAFEISINNILLWSKLQTGRLPSNDEFIQLLQSFT